MPDVRVFRGATPTPAHVIAAARPYAAAIGGPPTFIVKPNQISMWGNDTYGDCVTAEEAFAKACNNPEIFISDAEVITWATNHGVLNGAGLPGVLAQMQTDGFVSGGDTYDDGPYSSVNFQDAGTLQAAICEGPVKIGIAADQMEAAYWAGGGKTGWVGTGFHNDGAAEDHCVSLCGYGPLSWLAEQLDSTLPNGVNGAAPGYAMFTWNSIGIIDEPSMLAITFEAWLRQPTTITKAPLTDVVSVSSAALPGGIAQVFATTADEGIHTTWKVSNTDGAAWTSWRTFPGLAKSIGSADVDGGIAQLFVVGDDNGLWTCWKASHDTSAAWTAWQPMPGAPGNVTSFMSTELPGGLAQIFVTLSDETIHTTWKVSSANGAAWAPWQTFPGLAKSMGSAIVDGGIAQLFAVGSDNGLWTCWKASHDTSAAWTAWQPMPGAPGNVTSFMSTELPGGLAQIFVTLSDETIHTTWKVSSANGAAWAPWQTFPGLAKSMGSAIVDGGIAQLFAVGSDNGLWTCWKASHDTSAAWTSWRTFVS